MMNRVWIVTKTANSYDSDWTHIEGVYSAEDAAWEKARSLVPPEAKWWDDNKEWTWGDGLTMDNPSYRVTVEEHKLDVPVEEGALDVTRS